MHRAAAVDGQLAAVAPVGGVDGVVEGPAAPREGDEAPAGPRAARAVAERLLQKRPPRVDAAALAADLVHLPEGQIDDDAVDAPAAERERIARPDRAALGDAGAAGVGAL